MSARILFTLSMPGRSSWNGRWSGQDRNYSVVRTLTNVQVAAMFSAERGFEGSKSWTHRWRDGWCACIDARVVRSGERIKKSDGFNGYDWMIDNIITSGSPYSEVTS